MLPWYTHLSPLHSLLQQRKMAEAVLNGVVVVIVDIYTIVVVIVTCSYCYYLYYCCCYCNL